MLRDEEHQGGIVLLHNGQPLPGKERMLSSSMPYHALPQTLAGRQTLQDAGIRDNDEATWCARSLLQ